MSHVPLSEDRLDEIRALAIDMEAMRTDIIRPFVSTPQPRPPVLQALMDVLAEVDRQRVILSRLHAVLDREVMP